MIEGMNLFSMFNVLYCYERDFKSELLKSKRHNLINMFNDTSRYLDDIFTIEYSEFEKHIPDIYSPELQWYKANTSDKATSFLNLNIKVIDSDIHTGQRLKQTRLLRISYNRQIPLVEW